MDHKIAHFADISLADESPQHISTVVTVGRFVEGLFNEEMAVPVLDRAVQTSSGGRALRKSVHILFFDRRRRIHRTVGRRGRLGRH